MNTFIIDGQKVSAKFRKNKFSVWQYDASCNGKRTRKSTKQRDRKLAEDVLQEDLANIVKLSTRIGSVLLITDIWQIYCSTPSNSNPGKERLKAYQQKVDDFAAYAHSCNILFVHEVTDKIAKQYIQYIRKNGRFIKKIQHVKKLSAATKNEYLSTLRMIFGIILKDSGLDVNPFADIQKLRSDKVDREIYSLQELDKLTNSDIAKASYLYPLIMVAPHTGLREGDVCTLEVSDMQFDRNNIHRLQRKTGTLVDIPMMDALRIFLEKQDFSGKYLFPELAKQYFANSTQIGKDFTKLLAEHSIVSNKKIEGRYRLASVKDVHSFRHTFVYLAAINRIPLPVVQSVVGHSSQEMTKMYMNHATNDDKQAHFKNLSTTISGKKTSIIDRLEAMTADNWQDMRDELLKTLQ